MRGARSRSNWVRHACAWNPLSHVRRSRHPATDARSVLFQFAPTGNSSRKLPSHFCACVRASAREFAPLARSPIDMSISRKLGGAKSEKVMYSKIDLINREGEAIEEAVAWHTVGIVAEQGQAIGTGSAILWRQRPL